MHVGQRSAPAPSASSSSATATAMDLASRGAAPSASAGMAGIGAGRSGLQTAYRPYYSGDNRSHHDYSSAAQWSNFDSSQHVDPSQPYGTLPSATSISSFDTQSHGFDAMSLPSTSTLFSSQSMQHLGGSIPDSANAPISMSASNSSTAFSSTSRAASEADLLAYVNEKRVKAALKGTETRSGSETTSTSRQSRSAHSKAGSGSASASAVDTLDLCHKRIDSVPDALVEMIKHDAVRLALGYNHLTRLPDSFADLSSLRYLNIRANNFAHFPECVTKMPNLEILDLSRNKIRKLPDEPGRLIALRVLSMNANRLTELPTWIGKMKHLRILKLDNNPLEWPPPHISKMPNVAPPKAPSSSGTSAAAEREKAKRFEDRQMLVWIAKLRSWINDPNNQPQIQTASIAQLSNVAEEDVAATNAEALEDAARPTRTELATLPSAPSDGLLSLQVEVPASVSDRTIKRDSTESNLPYHSQNGSVSSSRAVESTPTDTPLVTAGLLPPLIPQPPASAEPAELATMPDSAEVMPFQQSWSGSNAKQDEDMVAREPGFPAPVSDTQAMQPIGVARRQIGSEDVDNRQHARNNSHSVVQDIAATHQMEGRRSLKSKKSLPDLRKSHEDILQERRDVLTAQLPERSMSEGVSQSRKEPNRDRSQSAASSVDTASSHASGAINPMSSRKPLLQTRRAPRPNLGNFVGQSGRPGYEHPANGPGSSAYAATPMSAALSQNGSGGGLRKLSLPTVGATQAAADAAAAALAARAGYSNTPPRFDVGHGRIASDRGDGNWPARSASPTVNNPRTAADQERNSYFRRLSTLPPSTISKAVPVPVLRFVDGTRGVLFALSQIHAAIGQFMTPVIDERISGQFHRLLDISNGSVANLINALDRFDSLSRGGTPDPSVIRGVLVTCKDSVITFRKLISVLQLQLRALQSSSDVRYARTLLLMLYGSMGEVCNSWTEMAPLVEAVQPYLTQLDQDVSSPATPDSAASIVVADKPTPPSTRAGSLAQKSISNVSNGSAPTLPSIAEATTPVRAGSRPYLARGPSRRRHAGSFSAQDLAQGAAMTPSNSDQPPFNLGDLQAASAYNTPARAARSRRQESLGNSASSAATFAQSDSSDRHTATEQASQSTAPSTPGGTVAPGTQRNIYATPGAMSTPTSSRQKRSGSSASSAFDVAAPLDSASGAMTPRSQVGTPATPGAVGSAKRHATSHSIGNAAATTAAGNRLHMAVADQPKITVDDHLLDMVDNITKLSARVWSMLFEHLRSAGVDDKQAAEKSQALPADGKENSDPNAEAEIVEKPASAEEDSDKDASAANAATGDTVPDQRLHELRELAQITDDLTSQLRSTYLRAREEEHRRTSIDSDSGRGSSSSSDAIPEESTEAEMVAKPPTASASPSPENITQETVTKLFDESHQFVRAIVNTSTLIKSIASSHEFPRDLRRMLGQVAQACSNLTVYLLWLSPANVS